MKNKYFYNWNLKNANFTKNKGKVFSCFSCGGGSTMGYKLAGFDVIGMNEVDKKVGEIYLKNHNPKYPFIEPIQTFKNRNDFPKELFELDILDGSPPCSSFSIAGAREKDWNKKKKFREGQTEQVLDTLFFDFIELAKKLQPKVVVSENVKGILMGNAIEYVKRIYDEFDSAGYYTQHFVLDSSKMGVPQKRERVFFISFRKDLASNFLEQVDMFTQKPKIKLNFNDKPILFDEIIDMQGRLMSENMQKIWKLRKKGDTGMNDAHMREFKKPKYFSQNFVSKEKVARTITSHEDSLVLFDSPRYTSRNEVCKIGSFPLDFDFLGQKPHYLIGMSVPPLMIARISDEIHKQWLSKL